MANQRELVQRELEKVIYADLSDFDVETNTYHIPQRKDITLTPNRSYIVRIKPSLYRNDILKNNYNNGNVPPFNCYLVDIVSRLGKVIKVNAVEYDLSTQTPLSNVWSGYLAVKDIEIVREI